MFTQKWYIFIFLSICFLLLACSDEQITDFQEVGKKEVLINVRGLSQISFQGEERDIISVAESLILKIKQSDGKEQERSVKLTPRDSVIKFEEVVVEKGTVVFSAEILSNNGTLIYSGSKVVDVSQDEYAVEIKLEPVGAILAVGPGSLFANPIDTFWVFNRGKDNSLLNWNVGEITPVFQQTSLEFEPIGGEILGNNSREVTAYSGARSDTNFGVRIESQVGHVDLNVQAGDGLVKGKIHLIFDNIQGGISVTDSLHLKVTPKFGTEQIYLMKLNPSDSLITLNLGVQPVPQEFNAEIFSNNQTLIYAGSNFREVIQDGFEVDVNLEPVDAIFGIVPESITSNLDGTHSFGHNNFSVVNIGVNTLEWWIEEITPSNWEKDLSFNIYGGGILRDSSIQVLTECGVDYSFNVRMISTVGYVNLNVQCTTPLIGKIN